jgi:transposase-like protein
VTFCPICGSKQIGKINRGRYFCGECCHEWTLEDEGSITVYKIAVDGTIARLRSKGNVNVNSLQRNAG